MPATYKCAREIYSPLIKAKYREIISKEITNRLHKYMANQELPNKNRCAATVCRHYATVELNLIPHRNTR